MNRLIFRGIKDQKGQSTVEFALVLPILLLIVFLIIEFGFIFNAYVTIISSAREGARYGSIGNKDEIEIVDKVKSAAGALDTSSEKFNVEVSKIDGELTVKVTYNTDIFDPILRGILGKYIPIQAKITMAIE